MALKTADADRAVRAAVEKATEMGISLAIAVVDQAGYPIAVTRMDGARGFTSDVAIGKAKVSALLGVPSARPAERMPAAIAHAINDSHGQRLVFWQGAVPITTNGETVGGIGASGSSSQNDEIAALAGAESLQRRAES